MAPNYFIYELCTVFICSPPYYNLKSSFLSLLLQQLPLSSVENKLNLKRKTGKDFFGKLSGSMKICFSLSKTILYKFNKSLKHKRIKPHIRAATENTRTLATYWVL